MCRVLERYGVRCRDRGESAERIGPGANVVLAAVAEVAPQRGAGIACQRVAVSEADDLSGRLG